MPNRNCPLAALMPDTGVFPNATKYQSLRSPAPKLAYGSRGVDSGLQEYLIGKTASAFDQPRATHEIQRWSTVSVAQRDYVERRDFALQTGDRFGPWSLPSAITHTNVFADETVIACGAVEIVTKMYRCWMVGRYQEYVVIFDTEIVSGVLELAQVNPILSDIDNRMGACLAKPVIAK